MNEQMPYIKSMPYIILGNGWDKEKKECVYGVYELIYKDKDIDKVREFKHKMEEEDNA